MLSHVTNSLCVGVISHINIKGYALATQVMKENAKDVGVMILRSKPSDVIKARAHMHQPRQCGHFDCLWGYSNPKHRPQSSNPMGRRQRRKLRSTMGTGHESKRAA